MERVRDSGLASNSSGDVVPNGTGGGVRHWMRAGLAEPTSGGEPKAARSGSASRRATGERGSEQAGAGAAAEPSQPPTKRFVEPYPFDDAQRRLIDQALIDAGVDDASGRAIFIGAIAYDVALLGAALQADEAPVEPSAELRSDAGAADWSRAEGSADLDVDHLSRQTFKQLADATERLREGLNALDPTAATQLIEALNVGDPFARGHSPGYLAAVAVELDRIAAACDSLVERKGAPEAEQVAGSVGRAAPALPSRAQNGTRGASARRRAKTGPLATYPAGQRFVEDAARVFREAFDLVPTSRAGDPFACALKAIATATELPIPSDVAILKQALTPG